MLKECSVAALINTFSHGSLEGWGMAPLAKYASLTALQPAEGRKRQATITNITKRIEETKRCMVQRDKKYTEKGVH